MRSVFGHAGLLIGIVIFVLLVVAAVFGPMVIPHDPITQDLTRSTLSPVWEADGSWLHPLGTDRLGRDYLARLLSGARISLIVGVGAASVGMIIGVTLGAVAGYFGGWIDTAISFLLTLQLSLPGLLLAMALVFLIGPSIIVVIGVIGCLHWSYFLVVTRASVMQIRALDFVAAAQVVGMGRLSILLREILPNLFNNIIIVFTLEMGAAVLAEATLSFLGVGIQFPTSSWGLMIAEGRNSMFFDPWLVVIPGIALFLLILSANLIGDGLRDVTTPERSSK